VPFTRAALNDKKVSHEIVLNKDGEADDTVDPKTKHLEELRVLNDTCCDVLNVAGYDGELLLVDIPRFDVTKRRKNMTKPRTKEQQDAIAAGGSIFLRAGGQNLNDNDCFVANERTQLVKKAKELREQATIRILAKTRADAAHLIMEKTPLSKCTCPDLKILIAWRTGKPCPSKATRKDALLKLHDKVKKIQDPTFLVWTKADEEALVKLEETAELEGAIALEDADCGRFARFASRSVLSLQLP
jgi:hypothetical protein